MTHACRALTYLMEALPRVTVHVTDAVPYLLEKVKVVSTVVVQGVVTYLFHILFLM